MIESDEEKDEEEEHDDCDDEDDEYEGGKFVRLLKRKREESDDDEEDDDGEDNTEERSQASDNGGFEVVPLQETAGELLADLDDEEKAEILAMGKLVKTGKMKWSDLVDGSFNRCESLLLARSTVDTTRDYVHDDIGLWM